MRKRRFGCSGNDFCFPPFFRVANDPTRQKILDLLRQHKELSVNELVKKIKLSQSTVSHHLATLKNANVVESRQIGTIVYYRISKDNMSCCFDFMKNFFG